MTSGDSPFKLMQVGVKSQEVENIGRGDFMSMSSRGHVFVNIAILTR